MSREHVPACVKGRACVRLNSASLLSGLGGLSTCATCATCANGGAIARSEARGASRAQSEKSFVM